MWREGGIEKGVKVPVLSRRPEDQDLDQGNANHPKDQRDRQNRAENLEVVAQGEGEILDQGGQDHNIYFNLVGLLLFKPPTIKQYFNFMSCLV